MIFDTISEFDVLRSMEAECAKALNEIKCARKDLEQAEVRQKFLLSAIHHLKDKIGQ